MWFHGTVLSHPRALGCGVAWQHSIACTPVRGRLHAPCGATWSMSPESTLLSCCFWRWQIKWDTQILASEVFPCVGAPSIRPRNGISCWPSSFWRQYCIAWGPFGKVDWKTEGQWEGGCDFWRKFRVGPRAGWVQGRCWEGTSLEKYGFMQPLGVHRQVGNLQSCFFWLHDAVCLRLNDGRVHMQEFS